MSSNTWHRSGSSQLFGITLRCAGGRFNARCHSSQQSDTAGDIAAHANSQVSRSIMALTVLYFFAAVAEATGGLLSCLACGRTARPDIADNRTRALSSSHMPDSLAGPKWLLQLLQRITAHNSCRRALSRCSPAPQTASGLPG